MLRHSPCLLLVSAGLVLAAGPKEPAQRSNVFAERGFVHVLGPSPAIAPNSDASAPDSLVMESGDVLKDHNSYYWYYHAQSKDTKNWPRSYRICVATAPTPLGPWKRFEKNPVLDHGPEGAWDRDSVDGPVIMKEGRWDLKGGSERYYMWYAARGPSGRSAAPATASDPPEPWKKRHIGLATATNPLGPWKKYERNPVVEDFGYLGGVVRVNGKFYMFAQHPVSAATDQGPFRVATADKPEGPWTKYEGNPVLTPGDWGAWDDGGYSEARVRYHEGVFHWFYGGTKTPKYESIGYAYSFDGFRWTKYGANPVVNLSRVPDAAGMSEVHAYLEGPFVYLYHTLRYFTGAGTARGISSYPPPWKTEDLAIQVLTIDPRFKVAFPVLSLESLAAKQSSRIQDSLPIGLESASSLALSLECTYQGASRAGLSLRVRGSDDGVQYDTVDLRTFEIPLDAGKSVRKSVELSPKVRYVKVIVENLDRSHAVRSINVKATVGN